MAWGAYNSRGGECSGTSGRRAIFGLVRVARRQKRLPLPSSCQIGSQSSTNVSCMKSMKNISRSSEVAVRDTLGGGSEIDIAADEKGNG